MPNFKKLLAIFLIRSVVIATCFSFALNAKAENSELYNQPFLTALNLQKISDSTQVTIALVDEGLDFANPELTNLQWVNTQENIDGLDTDSNGFIDDTTGWNFVLNSNNTAPLGGHGTKLAGIIKSISQKTQANIKIMPLVACQPNIGCDIKNIVQAIYYAVENKANVINLSLGTPSYSPELMQAITYAYQKGVVIVSAAGNGNQFGKAINLDKNPLYPICMDNGQNMVLGVSSVSLSGAVLPWANFGSCVDIYAPRESIFTTFAQNFSNLENYGYVEGSSYSAAEISALVASLKSNNFSLTNQQITEALKNSSKNNLPDFNLALNYSYVNTTKNSSSKKKYITTVKKQPLKVFEKNKKIKLR